MQIVRGFFRRDWKESSFAFKSTLGQEKPFRKIKFTQIYTTFPTLNFINMIIQSYAPPLHLLTQHSSIE